VALVRNNVSEELSASVIRKTRIGELGTLAVALTMEVLSSFETSVLTRAARRNTQKTAFFIVAAVKTSDPT
jgi:hypothetical protein